MAALPHAHESLIYFVERCHGTHVQWFDQRASCQALFCASFENGNKDIGFCCACSFTDADAVFNGLFWLQEAGRADANRGYEMTDKADLARCFSYRPQKVCMYMLYIYTLMTLMLITFTLIVGEVVSVCHLLALQELGCGVR